MFHGRLPLRLRHKSTMVSARASLCLHSPQCKPLSSPLVNFDPESSHADTSARYLIGQAIGGVFFPPYSETFGRKTLYVASTLGFSAFSAIVASVPSLAAVVVARFITGFLSAIPTIVVAGSIEDVFNIRARVWMIFIWATTGNVAVCIGPIYSTYITNTLGWLVQTLPVECCGG
jgi:MFS family permease